MDDILYGKQPVLETLRAGRRQIRRLWLRQGLRKSAEAAEMVGLASRLRAEVEYMPDDWFEKKTAGGHHQGMAVQASEYPYADFGEVLEVEEEQTAGDPPFWLILDHLEDPQNLGSLIRTADAMGVHAVMIPKDRSAGVTPAVVRASAGASEHVRVCMVTNLVQSMEVLKKAQVWLTGLEACPEAKPSGEADLDGAVGLVLGSEGKGLSRLVREHCDFLVRLPLYGQVNSLNAAIAGAIAMHEVRRRRELKGK